MKVYRRFIFDNGNAFDEDITDQIGVDLDDESADFEGIGEFFNIITELEEGKSDPRFYWSVNHTVINLDKVVLIEIVKY